MDALKAAQHKVTDVATGGEHDGAAGGEKEMKVVHTVDHRTVAGENEVTTTEPVDIVHRIEDTEDTTGKSMLTGAKEAVFKTVESVKTAFSGEKKTEEVEPTKEVATGENAATTGKSVLAGAKEAVSKTVESAKTAVEPTKEVSTGEKAVITGKSVLAEAEVAVSNTVESAKTAISGKEKTEETRPKKADE